jgi:hypothetical protein
VPWLLAALFVGLPLLLLLGEAPAVALPLLVLLVATPLVYARFER